MKAWDEAFSENPLIAILRGLHPDHAVEVTGVLVEAGFRIVEVPLNSPDPLVSIKRIRETFSDEVVIGAGTVLNQQNVSDVVAAGGQIIVSPNLNPQVGEKAIELNVKWCPGVTTVSEAFTALELGASLLKFFPAEMVAPNALSAMRAVLPTSAQVAMVGGITPYKIAEYFDAGANGFGLGSALFKPSYDIDELRERAAAFITELDGART